MFCRKVKAFFKSGIENVVAFCKKHKSTIARLAGKFVIYVCKTVIEYLLDNYSWYQLIYFFIYRNGRGYNGWSIKIVKNI